MKIIKLNDSSFGEFVKELKKPLVIKFYNPSCHLCKGIKPLFIKASYLYDQYDFAEIDASQNKKLSKFFDVSGVPQLYVIHNDKIKTIPYPENPDPTSGYSLFDIFDYLDTLIHMKE